MMCLSQTTGYAIQALSCLNESACECRLIADIAKCSGVPKAYLAKVFNRLVRRRLVTSKRGYRGGIALARKPRDITLLEIVEAIEDSHWIGGCLLNMDQCSEHSNCLTHDFCKRIRQEITAELRQTTLADVIASKKGRPAASRELKTVTTL